MKKKKCFNRLFVAIFALSNSCTAIQIHPYPLQAYTYLLATEIQQCQSTSSHVYLAPNSPLSHTFCPLLECTWRRIFLHVWSIPCNLLQICPDSMQSMQHSKRGIRSCGWWSETLRLWGKDGMGCKTTLWLRENSETPHHLTQLQNVLDSASLVNKRSEFMHFHEYLLRCGCTRM